MKKLTKKQRKKKMLQETDRKSIQYSKWRKSVLKRDNYTCQYCGDYDVTLNVHHIKPYYENRKLALDIENGITLCEECHTREHPFMNEFENMHNLTRPEREEYYRFIDLNNT
ncbi:MAG: HNH endonuclease [Nanoarchaeota archaeon]|nr:HNH endonuclease [Nanoarchaeota archaeon]